MNKRVKYSLAGTAAALAVLALVWQLSGGHFAVLDAKGTIAAQQRDLMLIALGLMLLVVIPVFILTFHIAWTYRAGNHKATYMPEWDGNRKLEALWWGIPGIIIVALSVLIWQSSHSLDPYRPIASASGTQPLTIQVTALQWKWLFIYPEQNIATVNYLQIPEDTPVNFEITADAPMNSFWIPQLGGQVYAMTGMVTKLHLMADEPGVFQGSSANLSGEGFSKMRFVTAAVSRGEFDDWVGSVRSGGQRLDKTVYDKLAAPGEDSVVASYASVQPRLFQGVVDSYGGHGADKPAPHGTDTTTGGRAGGTHSGYSNPTDHSGHGGAH